MGLLIAGLLRTFTVTIWRGSSYRVMSVCHAPSMAHCLRSSRDSIPRWADQFHESQEKHRLSPGDPIHPLSRKRRHQWRIFHPILFRFTLLTSKDKKMRSTCALPPLWITCLCTCRLVPSSSSRFAYWWRPQHTGAEDLKSDCLASKLGPTTTW